MEKSFCDYLVSIGLIDLKISNSIKFLNKEVANSRKEYSFTDSFFISLMHYFNNLTLNQKKYMCFSLPLRFILLKQKDLNKKLKSIVLRKNLKEKIIKLKYLLKWIRAVKFNFKIDQNLNYEDKDKLNINNMILDDDSGSIIFDDFVIENKKVPDRVNKKRNNNISFNERNKKIGLKINNSFNRSRSKLNNKKKTKEILTTTDRKELLQLSECTFKPTINTTNNNSFRFTNPNSNRKMTFMKLYQDSEKYRIKKRLKELEFEKIINNELTFKPQLCHTPKSISNFKFDSFDERQKNFINNKKENANKLKINLDKNTAKKCSFIPKVNKIMMDFNLTSTAVNRNNLTNIHSAHTNKISNSTNEENKQNLNINTYNNSKNNYTGESYFTLSNSKTIPAHLRLYNDSQRRNSSYIQKENEYNKLISDMANITSKKNSKVDYDKLLDLYENKEGKLIHEKTKQKVEKEEGITFMPELSLKNKYLNRITNDFYERNKYCRKNNIFRQYQKYDEDSKKNDKKYTDEQKKKIIKNIVNRLYNESKNKNSEKNKKGERNRYIKNYSFFDSNTNSNQNKKSEYEA